MIGVSADRREDQVGKIKYLTLKLHRKSGVPLVVVKSGVPLVVVILASERSGGDKTVGTR